MVGAGFPGRGYDSVWPRWHSPTHREGTPGRVPLVGPLHGRRCRRCEDRLRSAISAARTSQCTLFVFLRAGAAALSRGSRLKGRCCCPLAHGRAHSHAQPRSFPPQGFWAFRRGVRDCWVCRWCARWSPSCSRSAMPRPWTGWRAGTVRWRSCRWRRIRWPMTSRTCTSRREMAQSATVSVGSAVTANNVTNVRLPFSAEPAGPERRQPPPRHPRPLFDGSL